MSLKTWKEEFYPVVAADCPRDEALDHSIRKWEGLRKEELEKHGVRFGLWGLSGEDQDFGINESSCALCRYYLEASETRCEECPVALVRGGVSCDGKMSGEKKSPWEYRRENPEAMIYWLNKAKEAGK